MKLIFLRHATAVPKSPEHTELDDFKRELTRGGVKEIKRIFRKNRDLFHGIDVIYTSPLLRAMQTAETLYRKYPSKNFEILSSLDSSEDPSVFVEELSTMAHDEVMCFVGHEPHLTSSIKKILNCENLKIDLAKGGALLLEGDTLPDLSLSALIRP